MSKKVVISDNIRKVSERLDANGNVITRTVQEPPKPKEK